MRALAIGVVAALTVAAAKVAQLVAFACTSGDEEPGSFQADLCSAVGGLGTLGWWLAVLWPAAFFAASHVVPPLRTRSVAVAAVIALLAVAFWASVGVVAIDVG